MKANDSNGDTLPIEEDREIERIFVIVQKFLCDWKARRCSGTWK